MSGRILTDFAERRETELIKRCAGVGTQVGSTYYTDHHSCGLQLKHTSAAANIYTHI